MPVIFDISPQEGYELAVWDIQEKEEELISAIGPLNDSEVQELARISHPQKRLEWLASRYLLSLLAYKKLQQNVHVEKDQHNKPHLNPPLAHISLSHCFPHACAILSKNQQVGIDLEKPNPKLHSIAPKFLNKKELDWTAGKIERIETCWSAKEAIYKYYGRRKLSFLQDIEILPFQYSEDFYLEGTMAVNGSTERISLRSIQIAGKGMVFTLV